MAKKTSVGFLRGLGELISPTQCLNDIVNTWTNYLRISEEEKTKRREIEAWEKATLAEIKAKQDILIGYLEHSFDERAKNFQLLFQRVDQSMISGDNQQLALVLHTIVELAKSSPFKDLADLSTVQLALNNPDHVWEL